MKHLIPILASIVFNSCSPIQSTSVNTTDIPETITVLNFEEFLEHHHINHFKKMGAVKPTDWLAEHPESGQKYSEYLINNPSKVTQERNTIYLQPIGTFERDDSILLNHTATYLKSFYGLDVIIKSCWDSTVIAASGQRIFFGKKQFHTTYILHELLKPKLPKNAVAYMAITPTDLYPKEEWHFVFGQASIKDRVGVSSLSRLKEYDSSGALKLNSSFKRIAKTTSHEIGHMFSIKHCIKYKCIMNGSNHLTEADQKPMWLCPQCNSKVAFATERSILEHMNALKTFHKNHEMTEQNHYSDLIKTLNEYGWKEH